MDPHIHLYRYAFIDVNSLFMVVHTNVLARLRYGICMSPPKKHTHTHNQMRYYSPTLPAPKVEKLYDKLGVLESFAHCLDVIPALFALMDVAEIRKRVELQTLLCPVRVLLHPHFSLLAAASRSFTQGVTSSTKGDEVIRVYTCLNGDRSVL